MTSELILLGYIAFMVSLIGFCIVQIFILAGKVTKPKKDKE